jgi:TonB family protein
MPLVGAINFVRVFKLILKMYTKALFLSLLLFPVLLLCQVEPMLGQQLLPSDTGIVYKVVEQMPLFPGCEDAYDYAEMKQCADRKMIEYIYDLQVYPEDALEDEIEGMAVVSFIVEKDGRITSLECVREVCPSIKAEALYMVDVMAVDLPPWNPGKQDGKLVRVQFNLPIKFRLPRD